MSSQDAQHAFERFHRATGSSATTGTGLGLAITAAIIEAHEGRIDLETELSSGTAFTITLPTVSLLEGDPEASDPYATH